MILQMKNLELKECTYWSQEKKECTLCKGGVFIPMPDHIAAYCQKDSFCNCPHLLQADTLAENRRHYSRQNHRYPIILKKWDSQVKKSESLPLKIDAKKQRDELFSTRN